MSYSLKFVDYYQPKMANPYFETDDIISMKKDPIAINSVDFNKTESRKCKIEIYAYDWIINTFLDNSSFINIDDRITINKYAIRVEKDDSTNYIGWLYLSDYSYDKKNNKIKFTLTDSLGLLIKLADKKIEYETQATTGHKAFVSYLLQESSWTNIFDDINYSTAYNFDSGVEMTDIDIPITDSDINEGIGVDVNDWLDITKTDYDNDKLWGWELAPPYDYDYIQANGNWEERYWIKIEYLGEQQFNIWIQKHGRGDYPQYSFTYRFEEIMWLKIKVEISGLDFIIVESIALERNNTEEGAMYDDWHPEWDDYTIFNTWGPNNPQVNWITVITYANNPNGNYVIDGDPPFQMGDMLSITYNTLFVMQEITIKEGKYSIKELLNAALFSNTLAIYTEKDSDLIIENKFENNTSPITISDSDVVEYNLEGIIKTPIKMEDKMSPVYFSDLSENILIEVEEYYNDMLPKSILKVEILNNYNLNIFNQINVFGEDYTINSIKKDNDNQLYTVEAWR